MNRIGTPAMSPAATAASPVVRPSTDRVTEREPSTSPTVPPAILSRPQDIVGAVQHTVQELGMDRSTAPGASAPPVKADATQAELGKFIQALFQAVHEQASGPQGSGADSLETDLPAALDRLTLQTSSGQAPSALQQAFVELKQELQARLPRDSALSFDPNNPPSLQQFLEALRHNRGVLGSHFPSIGNMLRIRA